MTKLLALDQALTCSGYAQIDTEARTICFGEIQAPKRRGKVEFSLLERLKFIRDTTVTLLKKDPDFNLALETPFISARQARANTQSLQSVFIILQMAAADLGVSCYKIAPTTWPKLIGLKTTKDELLKELLVYGLTNDHQSDAIGIGLGALVQERIITGMVNRQDFKYLNGTSYKLHQRK